MPRKKDDLSGWGGEEDEESRLALSHDAISILAGIVILFVWFASGVVGTLTENFQFLTIVTPIMAIYATFLFGRPFVDKLRQRNNGNGAS
jgi:hypothetical protein